MNFPRWALNAMLLVLRPVEGQEDRLGQRGPAGWQAEEWAKCAVYPVSRQGLERAQTLRVVATHEIYLEGTAPAHSKRVQLSGLNYVIQDTRQWQGFCVLLVQQVT